MTLVVRVTLVDTCGEGCHLYPWVTIVVRGDVYGNGWQLWPEVTPVARGDACDQRWGDTCGQVCDPRRHLYSGVTLVAKGDTYGHVWHWLRSQKWQLSSGWTLVVRGGTCGVVTTNRSAAQSQSTNQPLNFNRLTKVRFNSWLNCCVQIAFSKLFLGSRCICLD